MKIKNKKWMLSLLIIFVLSMGFLFLPQEVKVSLYKLSLFGGYSVLGVFREILKIKYLFIILCFVVTGTIFIIKRKYKKLFLIFLICSITFGLFKFHERNIMFRFEDYGTAKKAQEVLLKLHPVGSSVTELIKDLEIAGAECGPITNPEYKDKPEYKNFIYCIYYEKEIVFSTKWMVSVRYDENEKIRELDISSGIDAI